MKTGIVGTFIASVITLLALRTQAQTYDTNNVMVSTFAGYGIPSYVDGQGLLTAFNSPSLIVSDTASNLFVWDNGNQRIRKITPDRTVSTYAGGGSYINGYGTNVSLAWGQVSAMAMDNAGRIWLVMANSYYNNLDYLLTVDTNGYVSIVNGGLTNLTSSSGICFDSANNLYYTGGNRVYRFNPASGTVQPFCGSGIAYYFDGQGTSLTAFDNPTALACDHADNIYVWDSSNGRLRRIDPSQNVTTVAGNGYTYYSLTDGVGTNASFSGISAMFFDRANNLYLVSASCVRKMDAQTNVDTLAGSFNSSTTYSEGPGIVARFNSANGGCFSQGMVFVADSGNNRIRNLTFNASGQPVTPENIQLNTYPGVTITGKIGRIYQIQSSPNLTNWTATGSVLLNASPCLWIDQNPVAGNKFYRAVLLP